MINIKIRQLTAVGTIVIVFALNIKLARRVHHHKGSVAFYAICEGALFTRIFARGEATTIIYVVLFLTINTSGIYAN